MEWFGFISLMIIIMYADYPDRVRKLEKKIKKYQKRLITIKEEKGLEHTSACSSPIYTD